jgi:hypothetical protein
MLATPQIIQTAAQTAAPLVRRLHPYATLLRAS